ncbi:MAG TPA: hypothetical protein VGO30_02245 [Mycobacterium sp.]|nr:hypothetical protein [Mycobacterium sp.]
MGSGTTRIGGAFGIAAAAVVIPAYLVGSPEVPSNPEEAKEYVDRASSFLTANGSLPLLHLLFGLLFLGVLVSVLRAAAGPTGAVYVALGGGVVFLALTAAGLAAEVAVPAAIVRFGDLTVTEFGQPFLSLAVWLYHYSQIGSAALIFATGYLIWRTGVFPKWSALLAVLGIPALLHLWIGVPSAYTTIGWIGLTGLLMLVLPPVVRVGRVDV